jgi:hypothetical protein
MAARGFSAAVFLYQAGVAAGNFHWKLMVVVVVYRGFCSPGLQLKAVDWTASV